MDYKMIQKHAYLIMAHTQFYVLEKLIKMLDDPRNDIYVHIDAKVRDFDFSYYARLVKKSNLVFTPCRIDACWGHLSLVEVELQLFGTAFERGGYSYYHLLSGVDLPIKSQDDIHSFFEEHHGKECIGFCPGVCEMRGHTIYLFPKSYRNKDGFINYARYIIRELFLRFQKVVRFKINRRQTFYKGSEWVSLTHPCVALLLSKKNEIRKTYRYSICPDEVYKQTLIYHSPFKDAVYDLNDDSVSSVRHIDWTRGEPYAFGYTDLDELKNSRKLFARKFDADVDKTVIDEICRLFS